MAEPADLLSPPDPQRGFEIRQLTEDEFREFARQHATSAEIGPIATFFDDEEKKGGGVPYLLGIVGCGKLCAATCCTVTRGKHDQTFACKLDSVIVDGTLRRQGLAGALVAHAFLELLEDSGHDFSTFYAHSVHPATVKLLKSLTFTDPLPTGAPISSLHLDETNTDPFVAACRQRLHRVTQRLKLQCQLCMKNPRRARPWCQNRKEYPGQ